MKCTILTFLLTLSTLLFSQETDLELSFESRSYRSDLPTQVIFGPKFKFKSYISKNLIVGASLSYKSIEHLSTYHCQPLSGNCVKAKSSYNGLLSLQISGIGVTKKFRRHQIYVSEYFSANFHLKENENYKIHDEFTISIAGIGVSCFYSYAFSQKHRLFIEPSIEFNVITLLDERNKGNRFFDGLLNLGYAYRL